MVALTIYAHAPWVAGSVGHGISFNWQGMDAARELIVAVGPVEAQTARSSEPWSVAVQSSFPSKAHVNVQEMLGVLVAGRAAVRHQCHGSQHRGTFLVDN